MGHYIRIVKRPQGEAPESIRDAWVGLRLPVLPRDARPRERKAFGVLSMPKLWFLRDIKTFLGLAERRSGFMVKTESAVDVLRGVSPEAAEWWTTNASHLFKPSIYLLFEEECCVLEEEGSVGQ